MSVEAALATRFGLRCHSCSHGIGYADAPVRIAGLFKPSYFGPIPERSGEVRRMCRKCRWLNVFEPVAVDTSRMIELKSVSAKQTP